MLPHKQSASDTSLPSSPFTVHDDTWREIERLLAEVERAAGTCECREEFYVAFIERAALALGAASGCVWSVARGRYDVLARFEFGELSAGELNGGKQSHLADGPRVRDAKHPTVTPLNHHIAGQRVRLVSSGICLDRSLVAVMECAIAATEDTTSDDNLCRVAGAFAVIAEDFERHEALRSLKHDATFAAQFRNFAERIHRSLEIRDVVFEIANEARLPLGVDRVSVLQCEHGKCRTLAISNLAVVDRRNRTIAALEDLAAAATRLATPVWHGVGGSAVPELDEPLQRYLDISHSRVVGVVPLAATLGTNESNERRVHGAIVVESFSAEVPASLRSKTEVLAVQAALALRNALDHSHMPLRRLVLAAADVKKFIGPKHLPRTFLILGGIAACVAALILIPANFTIEATGQLEPVLSRNIHAPLDGEITELRVQHDSPVAAGETLLVIRSAELDLQHRRIGGERAATHERLLAVESDRIISRSSSAGPLAATVATEEELRRRLASLDEQLAIVEAQRQALEVRSPIRGRVLTWEAEAMLAARPVRRGQILLSVADVDGKWQLKLHVPDHDSGYVLDASRAADAPLAVEFALATEPGVIYRGTIGRTARITSLDQTGQSVVEVNVEIQDREIRHLRPGADAIAKIHCGRRSIGFVWLRDVIEFVQAKILF